ncbi:SLATT domain-containing protein [Streptomyces sp. NPDC005402]|uniref:SLATT domain-containing protein n=1 Tax=Streptomyces sp. NPDC005402 TaxID=3155338 RepID=UPI0033B13ACA
MDAQSDGAASPAEEAKVTLRQWCHGVRITHRAQEQTAAKFDGFGRALAVGSLVISAVVGTAIFSTLSASPALGWKIVVGLLSIIAAVLSALQAGLKYPERADRHRQAALDIGNLRHKMEITLTKGDPRDDMPGLAEEWDSLQKNVPTVPRRLYARVEKELAVAKSG